MAASQDAIERVSIPSLELRTEGSCADCGRWTVQRARCLDPHTHSEVELCAHCIPAFLQRQQFPPGCCG